MTIVKHKFHSGKGDGPDSTRVKPSAWNDDHDIATEAASVYLGRDQSGDGPAQELPVVTAGVGDDGTIWTAAKIEAAIAAAIAAAVEAIHVVPPGTVVGSINGTMVGYLPLNGTSFGPPGSGATHMNAVYQNLFNLIWNVIPTWPINGTRGVSSAQDWTDLKSITMPDTAGHVLGAAGGSLGGSFFAKLGAPTHTLTEAEMPSHVHSIAKQSGTNAGGGSTGGGSVLQWDSDGPYDTDARGGGAAHNNLQPTFVVQVFWIKY